MFASNKAKSRRYFRACENFPSCLPPRGRIGREYPWLWNTSHATYHPYQDADQGKKDLKMQAALYDAALQNIANDHLIDGVFIWAWSKPPFAPNSTPAAQTIHQWYERLAY